MYAKSTRKNANSAAAILLFHLNLKRRVCGSTGVGMTLLFRVFPCRILGSKPLNSFLSLELIFSWDA